MKATLWLVMVALFLGSMVSLAAAQTPAVTHNTWTSGVPLPTAVAAAASAVLKDEIYVVGGGNGTEAVADVQIYNPATNAWSAGVSLSNRHLRSRRREERLICVWWQPRRRDTVECCVGLQPQDQDLDCHGGYADGEVV
ncbi:MAG: kelch repeat-containing protein [Terriglobales bacterium]|jgi:hypothetical protein